MSKDVSTSVIFRLSAMGDIVLLTGLLRYLHMQFGMTFIVITRENFAPIFENHPAVREVFGFRKEDLQGKIYREKCKELAFKYENFPLFDMHASNRSRILSFFWRNSVFRYQKLALQRRLFLWSRGFFYGEKLRKKNVCQRYASVFEGILPKNTFNNISQQNLTPNMYLSDEERTWAENCLENLFQYKNTNIGFRKKIIALHPFATHTCKSLPLEKWKSLSFNIAERFKESHEILWLGLGDLGDNITGKSLVNKTSLRELCAILSACDILITGDSGPMHLANGLDCKILALFGATCKEWGFFPIARQGENQPEVRILQKDISCRPCSLHGAKPCPRKYACYEFTDEYILNNLAQML